MVSYDYQRALHEGYRLKALQPRKVYRWGGYYFAGESISAGDIVYYCAPEGIMLKIRLSWKVVKHKLEEFFQDEEDEE